MVVFCCWSSYSNEVDSWDTLKIIFESEIDALNWKLNQEDENENSGLSFYYTKIVVQ